TRRARRRDHRVDHFPTACRRAEDPRLRGGAGRTDHVRRRHHRRPAVPRPRDDPTVTGGGRRRGARGGLSRHRPAARRHFAARPIRRPGPRRAQRRGLVWPARLDAGGHRPDARRSGRQRPVTPPARTRQPRTPSVRTLQPPPTLIRPGADGIAVLPRVNSGTGPALWPHKGRGTRSPASADGSSGRRERTAAFLSGLAVHSTLAAEPPTWRFLSL